MRRRPRLSGRLTARMARGRQAEQAACRFLSAHGYVIEARNVRYPVGELDIVARESATLCFVEVRSRSSEQWGGALASITDRKRRRLLSAARWYLRYAPVRAIEVRFDVVAVDWSAGTGPAIELVRGAFTADDGGSARWW